MKTFDYTFTVAAPLAAVVAFHHDTRILKLLTPPPMFVQLHAYEPLGEGSVAVFTIWAGPIPLRWEAVHHHVGPNGFTDTQMRGPLHFWQHTHCFTAVSPTLTQIHEHIDYAHQPGWRGLLTRLLFSQPGLWALFTARKLITRRQVAKLGGLDGAKIGDDGRQPPTVNAQFVVGDSLPFDGTKVPTTNDL